MADTNLEIRAGQPRNPFSDCDMAALAIKIAADLFKANVDVTPQAYLDTYGDRASDMYDNGLRSQAEYLSGVVETAVTARSFDFSPEERDLIAAALVSYAQIYTRIQTERCESSEGGPTDLDRRLLKSDVNQMTMSLTGNLERFKALERTIFLSD